MSTDPFKPLTGILQFLVDIFNIFLVFKRLRFNLEMVALLTAIFLVRTLMVFNWSCMGGFENKFRFMDGFLLVFWWDELFLLSGETLDIQNREDGVVIAGDSNPSGETTEDVKDDRWYCLGVAA